MVIIQFFAIVGVLKANQMLKEWEPAGDAIDNGLDLDAQNKDLLKLKKLLSEKVRLARLARQKRERIRSERVSNIKAVWKHCKTEKIKLGRVALVASTTDELQYNEDLLLDDDHDEDAAAFESRWILYILLLFVQCRLRRNYPNPLPHFIIVGNKTCFSIRNFTKKEYNNNLSIQSYILLNFPTMAQKTVV